MNVDERTSNYNRELGMKETSYDGALESPDLVKFLAGVRNLILQ